MPPARKTNSKIEVILQTVEHRKSAVRFVDPQDESAGVTNIYVKNDGFQKLGTPTKVKVTVEAYDGD